MEITIWIMQKYLFNLSEIFLEILKIYKNTKIKSPENYNN